MTNGKRYRSHRSHCGLLPFNLSCFFTSHDAGYQEQYYFKVLLYQYNSTLGKTFGYTAKAKKNFNNLDLAVTDKARQQTESEFVLSSLVNLPSQNTPASRGPSFTTEGKTEWTEDETTSSTGTFTQVLKKF